jgi:hypothetical protein
MRWSEVVAMVMMVVPSVEHDLRCAVVPVSFTDTYSDAADPDIDAFRDNHWFVACVQRTGKCRHRQKRNKTKGKQSILHGTLFGWGRSMSRYPPECALGPLGVCIGLTSTALDMPLKYRGPAGAYPIKVRLSSPDPRRRCVKWPENAGIEVPPLILHD